MTLQCPLAARGIGQEAHTCADELQRIRAAVFAELRVKIGGDASKLDFDIDPESNDLVITGRIGSYYKKQMVGEVAKTRSGGRRVDTTKLEVVA